MMIINLVYSMILFLIAIDSTGIKSQTEVNGLDTSGMSKEAI